jgi:hypothetical protein
MAPMNTTTTPHVIGKGNRLVFIGANDMIRCSRRTISLVIYALDPISAIRFLSIILLSLAINTVTLKNKKILHLNLESVIFIRLFIVFSHFGANILYNNLRY